jgi:cytochrome oxidase Cu insertion factor (SCO1/SenC/PrrC family)
MGLFLAGMAVLQAWPGRGFWQGSYQGQPGPLTAMVQSMAGTSQPSALSDLVSGFAGVARAHGFAVNLVAVAALAAIAAAMTAAAIRPGWHRLARLAVVAMAVLCAADWLLVQDLGFFGGLGTDPNSMIPMALLAVAGYLALARGPAPAPDAAAAPERAAVPWRQWLRPARLREALAATGLGTVTGAGAIAVVLLGAVPMAAAQASAGASPILAQAIDGSTAPLGNSPAPAITLTDQHGRRVSLASLRGKTVLLTFLDPVCVTDCPLIAQEFRLAGQQLGSTRVELVAVNLNPLYSSLAYLQAFDRQEALTTVPNWLYLTGSPAQLRTVWKNYGVASETLPAGAMLGHSDTAYVIDPRGRLYEELDLDPGPGTEATQASFASELVTAAQQAQARP